MLTIDETGKLPAASGVSDRRDLGKSVNERNGNTGGIHDRIPIQERRQLKNFEAISPTATIPRQMSLNHRWRTVAGVGRSSALIAASGWAFPSIS
ncbi:MAG: hypothetical protein H7A53_11005 [Akkermansiaceae bacterium]|nr:hypothetical protein [Akkermansiaceae bacterium]